ncbi:MAG: transglutaminase-like domain-containing protein [Dehalococcoidia bacterium]
MAHQHGRHICYCPVCTYEVEVDAYVKCNSLDCPQCGARMRAKETGELRIAESTNLIRIDDQPIEASFFGEVRRLTSFITPVAMEVQELYKKITKDASNTVDKIVACWKWVASRVKYVEFVRGKLTINGKTSVQNDLWTLPETTIKTQVGNCAVKSFLLTSLVRNELSSDQAYCALGNLYNGKPGGHAWCSIKLDSTEYIMESTRPTVPPLVPAHAAQRYEAVHYFNDAKVYAVEGKTQLIPMTACYSSWLSDYLNWAYIESQKSS